MAASHIFVLGALFWISRVWAVHHDRPNIIWVMADDLGWGELGLYPSSSAHGRIATPSLDKFGREGIVFTNAYAGYTVCAPSRTTFFTGRHSGQFVKHGLSGTDIHVKENVTTIAHVLQRAGYVTGAFGKVAPLTSPLQQGFDAFIGQVDQALCHNMYPKYIDTDDGRLNFELIGNSNPASRTLCMQSPEVYNFTVDVFHQEAMKWLESVAQLPTPFFLYLSFTVPHAGGWGDAPHAPEDGNPVPSDLHYRNRSWPDVEKDHAAVITYLDQKVNDLMQRLKLLDIDENTVVIFASDNGAHSEGGHKPEFFNSTGGLLGHKRSLFEGGVRSPTMVRWPAVISPGRTSDFAWAFWDALPTFAELAGTSPPPGLDGMSIVPTLRGEAQPPHKYLYFTWNLGYTVRMGKWKGVVKHCSKSKQRIPSMSDKMQLYDLEKDPFETTNVAEDHPSITVSMRTHVISKNLTCACYQCGMQNHLAGQEKPLLTSGSEALVI